MRKNVLTFLFCLCAMTSITLNSNAQSTLIYYWNFNGGAADSAGRVPDYKATGAGSAYFQYWCAYIDYTTGSSINIQPGYSAGNCVRFRQPSDSVTFFMPTTGYKNIKFSYAEQRTNSGALTNTVLFSVDGTNFVPTSTVDLIDSSTYTVDSTDATSGDTTEFELHTYSFATDTFTNKNAHFAVTIVFNGGPDSTSGNDRFDNFTLKGDTLTATTDTTTHNNAVTPVNAVAVSYSLFPNPAANNLGINSTSAGLKSVDIYNLVGQKIYSATYIGKTLDVNVANLNAGNYFVRITDSDSGETSNLKFTKQ